jgi:hypothetical protein
MSQVADKLIEITDKILSTLKITVDDDAYDEIQNYIDLSSVNPVNDFIQKHVNNLQISFKE